MIFLFIVHSGIFHCHVSLPELAGFFPWLLCFSTKMDENCRSSTGRVLAMATLGMTCQVNLQVSENFHREKCGGKVAAVVLGVVQNHPAHGFSRIYPLVI